MTQNIKWVLFMLHMVQPFSKTHSHQTNLDPLGAGALIAPLSATRFAQLTHWSSHYLVSLSLAIFITVVLAGVFRFAPQDGTYIAENFDAHVGSPTVEFTECLQEAGEVVPIKTEEIGIHNNKFGQLMKNKTVHLLAFFLMVYIGVEVTIGGMGFSHYYT